MYALEQSLEDRGNPLRFRRSPKRVHGGILAGGSPGDAALLTNRDGIANDFYLTPEASLIAGAVIESYGGAERPCIFPLSGFADLRCADTCHSCVPNL
jgi:hypothetical protein